MIETRIAPIWQREVAEATVGVLRELWANQAGRAPGDLDADLPILKIWFDPVASGARLRKALADLPAVDHQPVLHPGLVLRVSEDRALVTPEGCVALHLLTLALHGSDPDDPVVEIPPASHLAALERLVACYSEWGQHRIRDVTSLLNRETATMRPAVAGLLLVLLVNRNTAEDRALRKPDDDRARADVEAAITKPALAWSTYFSKKPPSDRGFHLYRGWAVPELKRRFGSGLVDTDEQIYIEPTFVDTAIDRLVEDLAKRPQAQRAMVPDALTSLLAAYQESRSVLVGLGLAHERPSFTTNLAQRISAVAGHDVEL